MSKRDSLYPEVGLIDKQDETVGLQNVPISRRITIRENLVFTDTRDCIATQSLQDARTIFLARGGLKEKRGDILDLTGFNISPVTVTINAKLVTSFGGAITNGQKIIISQVNGNTNVNGIWTIQNLNQISAAEYTLQISSIGNSNWGGAGIWTRPADKGWPTIKQQDSVIERDTMTSVLKNKLRLIKSIAIQHCIIPRDIVPLSVYLPDLVAFSTNLPSLRGFGGSSQPSPPWGDVDWTTYIPLEPKWMEQRMIGFYSTPLRLLRCYYEGSFVPPDGPTPPPLNLWNPPIGAWPNGQPTPYPLQTVPTYKSEEFGISGEVGRYYVVFSGYGVYDLVDWTFSGSADPKVNEIVTDLLRKLLLLIIVQPQSYREKDSVDMIIGLSTIGGPFGAGIAGYGNLQRFLPGPGMQLQYQPGTSDGANPTAPGPSWPIAFPLFRGNVWGPYDAPGDRFQKVSVKQTLQDLYLNGDMQNLDGFPIIKPFTENRSLLFEQTAGLNFTAIVAVTFGNVQNTNNLNILNATRIVPNGFGALGAWAKGSNAVSTWPVPIDAPANTPGGYYVQRFQNAGGQGPSCEGAGPPTQEWTNNAVVAAAGSAGFCDPIATGPQSSNPQQTAKPRIVPPQDIDARFSGTTTGEEKEDQSIYNRISWYDLGAMNGRFLANVVNWQDWMIDELPDTNIVIDLFEAPRGTRSQSTNSSTTHSLLSCPIRLNVGTTSGTQQYIENVQSLLAGSGAYWTKRFLAPLASLHSLKIRFSTYEGVPIYLEKMLEVRRSAELLRNFERIFGTTSQFDPLAPRGVRVATLFDPLDPKLIGREKRNISIVFNIQTYEFTNPGMELRLEQFMLESSKSDKDYREETEFVVQKTFPGVPFTGSSAAL